LLGDNREVLDRIVHVLLEKETINGDELDRLIRGDSEPPALTPSDPPAPPAPPMAVETEKEKSRSPHGLQPGLAGV